MTYYCVEGNKVKKYEITFDINELIKLQKECVIACGKKSCKKTHVSILFKRDDDFIYETNSEQIGYREDFYGDVPIYEKTYIEFEKPELYYIINEILNGNIKGIIDLFKMNMNNEYSFDREISNLLIQTSKIEDTDVDKKIKILNKIKKIKEEKEYNKNQKSILEYYKKAIKIINIKLTGEISLDEVRNVEDFLGYKLNINENDELIKTLKRKTNENK